MDHERFGYLSFASAISIRSVTSSICYVFDLARFYNACRFQRGGKRDFRRIMLVPVPGDRSESLGQRAFGQDMLRDKRNFDLQWEGYRLYSNHIKSSMNYHQRLSGSDDAQGCSNATAG